MPPFVPADRRRRAPGTRDSRRAQAGTGVAVLAARRSAARVSRRLTPPSASAGSHATAALTATAASAASQGMPSATSPTTSAPSRGLAPFGSGDGSGHLAGPEGPEHRERRQVVPRGVDGAHEQRRDGELVGGRQHERVEEPARRRERATGKQVGPDAPDHERDQQREHDDPHGDQRHVDRERGAGEDDEGGQAERADQSVGADAEDSVAAADAGAGQPVDPPDVGADVPGREQAEQLALGVGPQVPPAAERGVGERAPPQGAQDVLADDPRHDPDQHRPRADVGESREGEGGDERADDDTDEEDDPRPGQGAEVVHRRLRCGTTAGPP